jgi:hypothetical protein
MYNKSKLSKSFLVEIENFLYQLDPVRSTGIQIDLGEEEPSSWALEFSHGALDDPRGLVASLYRLDQLEIDFDVELSLSISGLGLKDSKVSPKVGSGTEANQDQPCLVLENFVTEENLLKISQFSNGTISIQCELTLYYSNVENVELNRNQEDRTLTFGTVEELHYIKVHPKAPFLARLIKSTRIVFEDFTRNLEKDNNLNCLINLHL